MPGFSGESDHLKLVLGRGGGCCRPGSAPVGEKAACPGHACLFEGFRLGTSHESRAGARAGCGRGRPRAPAWVGVGPVGRGTGTPRHPASPRAVTRLCRGTPSAGDEAKLGQVICQPHSCLQNELPPRSCQIPECGSQGREREGAWGWPGRSLGPALSCPLTCLTQLGPLKGAPVPRSSCRPSCPPAPSPPLPCSLGVPGQPVALWGLVPRACRPPGFQSCLGLHTHWGCFLPPSWQDPGRAVGDPRPRAAEMALTCLPPLNWTVRCRGAGGSADFGFGETPVSAVPGVLLARSTGASPRDAPVTSAGLGRGP